MTPKHIAVPVTFNFEEEQAEALASKYCASFVAAGQSLGRLLGRERHLATTLYHNCLFFCLTKPPSLAFLQVLHDYRR